MTVLHFRVEGSPVPKPRARITRRGNFVPANYTKWRRLIQDEAHVACLAAQDTGNVWRCDAEAYAIRCVFHMPDRRRRDIDNLAGSVLDALTIANMWPDDHLVDVVIASKVFGSGWSGVEVGMAALCDGWRKNHDLSLVGELFNAEAVEWFSRSALERAEADIATRVAAGGVAGPLDTVDTVAACGRVIEAVEAVVVGRVA